MNTLRFLSFCSTVTVAVLGAALSVQAQAQSTPSPGWVRSGGEWVLDVPFVSQRTRDEVRAELMAFRASDEFTFSGGDWVRRDRFVSTRTRAEVLAEAAASRARGDFVSEGDELVSRHLLTPPYAPRHSAQAATPIAQAR